MIGHVSNGNDEWRVVAGFWTLAVSILLLPVILLVAANVYTEMVPAYSAAIHIKEIDATVALRFYWVWDGAKDEGRYLSVRAPSGGAALNICGFDWAHWARTSVYLTEERAVAVLGPHYCDYILRSPYRTIDRAFRVPSDSWIYLGAFDFRGSGSRHILRFIPAMEQRECIPMSGQDIGGDWAPRNGARAVRCRQSSLMITGAF
jgi:hypothetical protein